jgi:anthranilate phosphoribosyltransferase
VLNAAAALIVGDRATNLKDGVEIAAAAIDNGAARRALQILIATTNAE